MSSDPQGPPGGGMRLKILRMGGTSYDVTVPETATVGELKAQLAGAAALPAERQRLIFRGRVLQNEARLSEVGVANGHTLHLVEMGVGTEPGAAAAAGAAAGAAAAAGGGADFWGSLLGGLAGLGPTQPGMVPPGAQGAVLGSIVLEGGPGGGVAAGDLGSILAQQLAAALGGGAVPVVAGMAPQGAAGAGPAGAGPGVALRMPVPPVPRQQAGPYPHLLTGLNLMMSRMEHEWDEPELDPLPRVREFYGRPSPAEVAHFLRAARALLNSSPLLRATRNSIDRILERASLPALRPRPWQRAGMDEEESEAEEEEEEEESSSDDGDPIERGVRWRPSSGGGSAQGSQGGGGRGTAGSTSGAALRSFPVPAAAEAGSDDEQERGRQRQRADRRASSRPGAAGDDDMPPLELVSDDSEEGSEWEEEHGSAEAVSDEDLILVAAVCMGELAARFLDLAGAHEEDPLYDLADELRGLTEVTRDDFARLANDVQELTARFYRLGSMWSELSRGMQYLGSAFESGNLAVVSAIPGYLMVQGSQATPNMQRPGFPPPFYLPPTNGYFTGQIPDGYGQHTGVPVGSTVVDIGVVGPFSVGAGAAGAAPEQPEAQQGTAGRGQQPGAQQAPQAAGVSVQAVPLANFINGGGGSGTGGAAGPGPGAAAAAGTVPRAPPAGAQQGQQQQGQSQPQQPAGARQGTARQVLTAVDSLLASTRVGVDQAAQRVHEARNAMQAVILGRNSGPQAVLERAHHTMQALLQAEEAAGRARQRTEQAVQYLQRVLRTQQGAAVPGQPQVVHQAVTIRLGGPGGAQQGGAQQGGAQQGQRNVTIPIGALLQQALQGALGPQQQQQGPTATGAGAGVPAAGAGAGGAAAEAAGAAAGGDGVPVHAFAQELLASMGMSPEAQQQLMQQFTGVTQALRQSSIASLDLPALVADIRTSLGTVLRDTLREAQDQREQRGGATAAGDQVVALTERAVPRLTSAVQAALNRHLSRLAESPTLREFAPHLHEMGIDLQPLQEPAEAAPPAEAAAATQAPASTVSARAIAAEQPAAASAAEAASTAAAAQAAAAVGGADAANQHSTPAPVASDPAAGSSSEASTSAAASGAGPSKPAGLGLGKGLARPLPPKKRGAPPVKVSREGSATSVGAGLIHLMQGANLAPASPTKAGGSAAAVAALVPPAAERPPSPNKAVEPAAAAPTAGEAAAMAPAPAPAAASVSARELPSAAAAAEPTGAAAAPAWDSAIEVIPPRPAAPRAGPGAPAAGAPNLANLMSGLLGGPPGAGDAAGDGSGGGGLMGLMGSVMNSPAFMQMAQSPAMQQMAERMLGGGGGGGAEGGGLDMGSLMSSLMGDMLGGPPGPSRQGPRARGMDGMLGGAGAGGEAEAAPADLDSALSVLPPEEAARWRETIMADEERQARLAAEQPGAAAGGGFSDAYSALRLAGGRGSAGSGLLGILAAGDGEQEGDEE